MPAVSKNQQRAAAIALKAKKEGTVNKLPKGSASKGMASMSEKELEKFAGTKHKGLPKKADKKEATNLTGFSLKEIFSEDLAEPYNAASMPPSGFAPDEDREEREESSSKWRTPKTSPWDEEYVTEEMLGLEPGKIATDKSKVERLEDTDDNIKDYKDTWPSRVNAIASHSRGPMTSNTRGARVAESVTPKTAILSEEIKTAVVKMKIMGEGTIKSNRWQELAGLTKSETSVLQENVTWYERYSDDTAELLSEMDSSQLKRYVIRLAKHGWGWEKGFDGEPGIADKLANDYGASPSEIRELKAVYENEVLDQEKNSAVYGESQNEAMLGGVSNSSPNPGHRAKMNELPELPGSSSEECGMCGGEVDTETGECTECGYVNPPDPIRVPKVQQKIRSGTSRHGHYTGYMDVGNNNE